MLIALRVKNLALVENVRVEFGPGLNVITGETGAGKSMLIGALNLLLGERADKKIIRTGQDACGAEAVFQLEDAKPINALLAEYGVSPCEDRQLILRRIVKASGTSQNLINDSPVTLQVLKQVGQLLVDMHGPHDHQSLLRPAYQLEVLDAFGHLGGERASYAEVYSRLQEVEERRAGLQGDEGEVAAQIDLLRYRVQELEEAGLREGEEEQVEQEHRVISNAQRILEVGGGVTRLLTEGEASLFDAMVTAQRHLDELARLMPEAEAWRDEARNATSQLQELSATIGRALDRIEADPSRLAWLEQRMGVYHKLRRKYGATVPELLEMLQQSKARLHDLQTRGERLSALEEEMARTLKKLQQRGSELTARRREAAGKLAKGITKELRELGFTHGAFAIEVREVEPQATGMNEVEFSFAPNVGEAQKPLKDIASSGEISRVMLAIKAVLAKHDRIPVLIFDEIDANIGGQMGNAVGLKLAGLASHHQVICITHLPQVASRGATHLAVTKRVQEGRTLTEVVLLDAKTRVEEIARMLGGRDLTRVTLQHAREMLEKV